MHGNETHHHQMLSNPLQTTLCHEHHGNTSRNMDWSKSAPEFINLIKQVACCARQYQQYAEAAGPARSQACAASAGHA